MDKLPSHLSTNFPHHQDEQPGGRDSRRPSLRKQTHWRIWHSLLSQTAQTERLTHETWSQSPSEHGPARKGKAGPHLLRGPMPGPHLPGAALRLSSGCWQEVPGARREAQGRASRAWTHAEEAERPGDRTPQYPRLALPVLRGVGEDRGSPEEVRRPPERGSSLSRGLPPEPRSLESTAGRWETRRREGDGSRTLPGAHLWLSGRGWGGRGTRYLRKHLQRQQQPEWRSGNGIRAKSEPAPWTRWTSPRPPPCWHRLVQQSCQPEVEEARLMAGPPQERGSQG